MTRFYSKSYNDIVDSYDDAWKSYSRRNSYEFITRKGTLSINDVIRDNGINSAIDYGCGAGSAMNHCGISVFRFDPFVERFSKYPIDLVDMIVAFNVLNIIEDQFFDLLITEFHSLCKRLVIANIMLPGMYRRSTEWYIHKLIKNHSHEFKIADAYRHDDTDSVNNVGRQRLYIMLEKIPA